MAKEAAIKLTKRTVDGATPKDVRYELWDSELSGFGLRVETSGRKSYIVRYRADGGGRTAPRRFMTIGKHGALTPEQARAEARRILGAVATGHDPALTRNAKREEMSISDLIDLYEKQGCVVQRGKRQGQPLKEMTKRFTLSRLRHHVVPLIGRKKLSEIRSKTIEQLSRDIAAGKTAKDEKTGARKRIIVRGGDGAARKVIRDLSAVFTFAQRNELLRDNPCDSAAVNKTDNKRRAFLNLEQVQALGNALRELEKEGVNPKAINIARLWALTGFRRNEAAALRRSDIDWERACVIFQDTKTGFSVRPLGAPALILLRSIPKEGDSDYFFPSERGATFYQGTKRVWAEAIRRAKLSGITPHTLRHTIGSTAVSTGETLKFTGALLGHATSSATEVYAHLQTDPTVRVADRVSGKIAAALEGKPKAPVISIGGKVKQG
jgi:integrase